VRRLSLDNVIDNRRMICMFEGEKVALRSLELTDLDTIMEFWNDITLRRSTFTKRTRRLDKIYLGKTKNR